MAERNKVKNRKGLPPLPAADAFGFNAQLRELYGGFRDITGTLRTQRQQILGQHQTQRQAILRARQQGLQDVEGAAIERGVLGGSQDFTDRTRVRANASTQLAEALNARQQALLANRGQAQQALRDLRLGVVNLQQAKAAQRDMRAVQDFVENSFGTPGGDMGMGGGGGAGGGAPTPQLKRLTGRIQRLIKQYGSAPPQQQAHLRETLLELWRKRNAARREAGMDPVKRRRLLKLLERSAANNSRTPGPGGQPGPV